MVNLIKSTSLVLFSIIVTLFIVELALAPQVKPKYIPRCDDCRELTYQGVIGYWHKESTTHHPKYYCEDKTVCFDVTYQYDSRGRRVVPNQKSSDKHIIFFGGSYAFGEGLNDKDSLPAQTQELSDQKVYNYGLNGAGATFTAAILESEKVKREVPEKKGVAFFIASDFQKQRGVISTYHDWCWNSPYYDYDKNGTIRNSGVQSVSNPKLVTLYSWYNKLKSKSNFLRVVDLEFPISNNEDMLQRMVDTLKRAKEVYERQFDGKFYVVLHPMHNTAKLKSFLRKEDVKYLEYNLKWIPDNEAHVCKCNGHPSKAYNSMLAKKMSETIKHIFNNK